MRRLGCRILGLLVMTTSAAVAAADVLHVPGEYPTIQAAINAAAPGDEVVVAPGTYFGPGNVNISFLGKAITVRSEEGPVVTIIDCGGQNGNRGFQFNSGEGPGSIIDGFTITDGFHVGNGGGIHINGASPTIKNCVITNCNGYNFGGGIFVQNGSPSIIGCTLAGNFVDFVGAGLYVTGNSHPTVTDSVFTRNIALAWGGGVFTTVSGSPTLTIKNCIFTANDGGGIRAEGGDVTIINTLVAGNVAQTDGGGVRVVNGHAGIINSTLFNNSATNIGGLHAPSSVVHNSIFWQNIATGSQPPKFSEISAGTSVVNNSIVQGGWDGAGDNVIDADPLFSLATTGAWTTPPFFEMNEGSTVFVDANASYEPGAFAGLLLNPNTDKSHLFYIDDNTANAIHVRGNLVGEYAGGHLAIAPGGDEPYAVLNVRPAAGSPAIDAGDNAALPPKSTTDLDGNPRVVDGTGDGEAVVDLGAYELQPVAPGIPGDLTGSGSVGVEDLLILLAAWGRCADPLDCPADLDGDGSVGVSDLLILLANWG